MSHKSTHSQRTRNSYKKGISPYVQHMNRQLQLADGALFRSPSQLRILDEISELNKPVKTRSNKETALRHLKEMRKILNKD